MISTLPPTIRMLLLMEWMNKEGLTASGGKWIDPWQPETPLDGYHHGWRGLKRRGWLAWASLYEKPYAEPHEERGYHGPVMQLNEDGEQFIKEFIVSAMEDDTNDIP